MNATTKMEQRIIEHLTAYEISSVGMTADELGEPKDLIRSTMKSMKRRGLIGNDSKRGKRGSWFVR